MGHDQHGQRTTFYSLSTCHHYDTYANEFHLLRNLYGKEKTYNTISARRSTRPGKGTNGHRRKAGQAWQHTIRFLYYIDGYTPPSSNKRAELGQAQSRRPGYERYWLGFSSYISSLPFTVSRTLYFYRETILRPRAMVVICNCRILLKLESRDNKRRDGLEEEDPSS